MNKHSGEPIPGSYITDKHKAEEVAYVEHPYQELISNARGAAERGILGMDSVLATLVEGMDKKTAEAAGEYDERRMRIEAKKASIAEQVLRYLKQSSERVTGVPGKTIPLIDCIKEVSYAMGANNGNDNWLQALHPDEFAEVRNVAFALLGLDEEIDSVNEFKRLREWNPNFLYRDFFSPTTGLSLIECVESCPEDGMPIVPYLYRRKEVRLYSLAIQRLQQLDYITTNRK